MHLYDLLDAATHEALESPDVPLNLTHLSVESLHYQLHHSQMPSEYLGSGAIPGFEILVDQLSRRGCFAFRYVKGRLQNIHTIMIISWPLDSHPFQEVQFFLDQLVVLLIDLSVGLGTQHPSPLLLTL